MKISNGVDIIKIARLKKSIENPRFLSRVYGEKELQLYQSSGKRLSFLAGNFAAKEAFSKALGTGIRGFWFTDIQVLRDHFGKPYFEFGGNALKIVGEQGLSFSVSISHEEEYAIAFVTAFRL